jgi:hypothetical protein
VTFDIEIVLRERNFAVTERVTYAGEPAEWTEMDVEAVLKEMLLSIDRVKHPDARERHVTLRGFSWIVEPAEGGVVIAIEIPAGAAVAGPFAVDQSTLDRLISRVLTASRPGPTVVH